MGGVAGYNVCWGSDKDLEGEVCTFVTSEGYTPLLLGTSGTYSLRVQTKDNAGNYAATYGTLFTYRFDKIAPAVGTPTLNIQSGSANIVYDQANRMLFYSTHSSGAISLGATITDSLSGADRMEFPAILGQAGQTVMTAPFTAAYPITGAESSVGAYHLTGFDQAGNLAQSTALVLVRDLSGPVMGTAEAPGTSGLMIPVRWAGADEFGGAGLRGYNVEMREGNGEWSRWLTETTQTNADFPGEDGKQYSFRVQGVDRVGNAGAWLETVAVPTNAVTKYYHMAGQRVAMRQGSAVYYLYGDHLGSTSLVTDAAGATLTETRYQPYGQMYWQWGATQTDYGFTGQRLDGFGLMDYNARYYSSTLGRFISPDTIIPQPGNPLAWDRYAYVNSNPVRYTDPSGHCLNIVKCANDQDHSDDGWLDGDISISSTPVPYNAYSAYSPAITPVPVQVPVLTSLFVSPPDFQNRGSDNHPAPPDIDGLPDDGWEWGDWPGFEPGFRNNQDSTGAVWSPHSGGQNPNGTEGEDPHWHRHLPEENGNGQRFPDNPFWGRGGQRSGPGVYNPVTGKYESVEYQSVDLFGSAKTTGVVTLFGYLAYRAIRILSAPLCGPAALACAITP